MRRLELHSTNVFFRPDATRVLVRAFIPGDPARVANILGDMDRHAEAAAAYGEAIDRSKNVQDRNLWTLHLLRAALVGAGRVR